MTPVLRPDAVVFGAGVAGSTFALNLAPQRKVLVLQPHAAPAQRVGESLPAAAARLLRDMGLLDDFLAQGHQSALLARSTWGSERRDEADALRNLDGHGWHLDRAAFDAWLQGWAVRRGACVLTGCRRLDGIVPAALPDGRPGWRWHIEHEGRRLQVHTPLVVDATGRAAAVARALSARKHSADRLVCGWLLGHDRERVHDGVHEVVATAQGWWYSSSLPGGRRLLAFHTDADLPAGRRITSRDGLLAQLQHCPAMLDVLRESGFEPGAEQGFCAANGTRLEPAAGPGWLALGDAALALDPLSSQGIFNALYGGLAGAEAAFRHAQEGDAAWADYLAGLKRVAAAYERQHAHWYAMERRWPDEAFWRRRHARVPPMAQALAGSPAASGFAAVLAPPDPQAAA